MLLEINHPDLLTCTTLVQAKRSGYEREDKFHQSDTASPVPLLTGQAAGNLSHWD